MALWRRRCINEGVKALREGARSGRTPRVTPEIEWCIINTTLNEKPAAATHWRTCTWA